ncbi:diacylglycerol kinase [Marinagarivorans cellulosilyticus]|uniref:Diacylglycerol kinase n=1 Tax=Marinagarivorans cellulosilyticus TaxID=2721545 RepID=A0AAN1WG38_9GAMM|nr:diacylglycerol kinase [Marinagarivorans cellulosilyticus]BCD96959.1 diacylglycerol kinase (ATP) [Marinagarivorans cellulosilyticus]
MAKEYNKPNGTGIKRIFNATLCSLRGLQFAWRFESAFRQEAILTMVLFPTTFFLAQSLAHWSVMVAALCILLLTELLNSAIETLADRITLNNDIMIGRAKDIGSAAVVIALSFITLLWLAALYSKFMT